jgi:formylglycine-generating enzyme required for sulfatase activity
VDHLVKLDLHSAQKWSALPILGVSNLLFESLEKVFSNPDRPESERYNAAALARYSFLTYNASSTKELMKFILELEGKPYSILIDWFIASGQEAANEVDGELDKSSRAGPQTVDDLARRQAHAAVALLQLEAWDKLRGPVDHSARIRADRLWPLLQDRPDPRLHSLRSYLSHRFARVGVKADVLLERYAAEVDVSARRALLLSLGDFEDYQFSEESQKPLVKRLEQTYRDDPDPGIHSAVEWLLRQWKQTDIVEKIDRELATGKVNGKRRWFVTARQGHTLAVIPGPVEFTMGSPENEPHRHPGETPHQRRIPRPYAIATKEVTVGQFKEFLKANPDLREWRLTESRRLEGEPDDNPVLGVNWFVAAQYCRWLSQQEGIGQDEMSYPSLAKIKDGMPLPADHLARTGYRLSTEAEWEHACRAGAVTSRPYGIGDRLLERYARYNRNGHGRAGPVGILKPNDLGLYDMLGNAWEWCDDRLAPYPAESGGGEPSGAVHAAELWVLRGGSFLSGAPELRSAHRFGSHPQIPLNQAGFRVARTWHP